MRLINTTTGLLEEFFGDEIPEYAILSHTWERDEISLQEFQRLTDPDFADDPKTIAAKAKAGFIKIRRCVQLAASKGIPYAWVDTCCIDKTSSADLAESINSMFRWYANSRICFAYLVDVEPDCGWGRWMESRWFTRGWTLQELIAPPKVDFYCQPWDLLSTKENSSLSLSEKTGILKEVLETNDLSKVSVAQKMSWASDRRTTREEDRAYCLLGLFDINMPLLYGEGEKAFSRLQEHIAASSVDHSLFAWGMPTGIAGATGDHQRSYRSIFARSPTNFRECGEVKQDVIIDPDIWTQTNRGFHAVFPTISAVAAKHLFNDSGGLPDYIDDTDYLVILNCFSTVWEGNTAFHHAIGIWISLIDRRDDGRHSFCRVTDFITLRRNERVSDLLNSSPDKFRKELWFATSRVTQVPRDFFSKRLGGFLIPPQDTWTYGDVKIHSLYGTPVSDGVDHLLPCPLLPLDTLGGLVGVVTIKYSVDVGDVLYKEGAKVVFGYLPGLKKLFVRVCWNSYSHDIVLLEHDLQEYALLEHDDDDDGDDVFAYQTSLWAIDFSLRTVFHKDMIFTQLDIKLCTWF